MFRLGVVPRVPFYDNNQLTGVRQAADLAVMGSSVAHDVFLLSYPKDPADETGYIGKRFLWRISC